MNLIGTTDFEKKLKNTSIRCFEILDSGYSKLRKIWALNSRSCVAHEIIERICKRSFPCPNATRWNSKFDSIMIAEKHRQGIKEAIDEINREVTNCVRSSKTKKLEHLTVLEWKTLKDYCTALQPVATALDVLQGDKRACQGYILPSLHVIKSTLIENIEEKQYTSEFGRIINCCVLEILQERFGNMMEFDDENKDLILSSIIHPNFKATWISDEKSREFAQTLLINAYVDNASSQQNRLLPLNQNECLRTESTESNFFNRLRSGERRPSSDDTLALDVWKYLVQPCDDPDLSQVLGMPILEDLFRKYNTTLSSSASIERIFSRALIIFTPRRNKISDVNFEKSLFLQQNQNLLI